MTKETRVLPEHLQRNEADLDEMRKLIESGNDHPVLMLNQNAYTEAANFPDGDVYRQYIEGLERLVERLGGAILWREPVLGQPVGELRRCDEILAIWFPGHRAYLDLPTTEGGAENYRLRQICVEQAHIYRCRGDRCNSHEVQKQFTR